jgi:hypothetical protein
MRIKTPLSAKRSSTQREECDGSAKAAVSEKILSGLRMVDAMGNRHRWRLSPSAEN